MAAAQDFPSGRGAKLTDMFTNYQELPLGIYEELFSTFFNHIVFKEWHGRHGYWQLQIIGPPGSGKTTLSALTAQRLRRDFAKRGVKVGVAAVFIKRRAAANDEDFMQRFLANVLAQLSAQSGDLERSLSDLSLEDLQQRLEHTVTSLERSFLVVDDVDACGRAWETVKMELQHLQSLGLKIMVTSRVPMDYSTVHWTCDTAPEIHGRTQIYWTCKECHARDNIYQIVCHECKANDKPCPKCGLHEHLHEPYASVFIDLPTMIGEGCQIFENFLASELEITHGDLGLGTQVEKPPDSALCKDIRINEFNVQDIVSGIAEAAECNIAMAKVRLSIAQEAQMVKELEKTRDRLPVQLIILFGAAINRVLQLPESERILGLVALNLVALPGGATPFRDLENDLMERGLLLNSGLDVNLTRVLHATCGLITVQLLRDLLVAPFHHEFGQYIRDDYNEDLAQA